MKRFGPIFVIGPSHPAVNILTWILGQHPGIAPLVDAKWLGPFSAIVGRVYGLATEEAGRNQMNVVGITRETFYQSLGRAISPMLLPNGGQPVESRRWVTGSVEFCRYVYGLVSLFPDARFVHVQRDYDGVRDPEEDAAALTDYQQVRRQWEENTRACLDAEQALGSRTVSRLRYAQLLADPEPALRRCLEFLGESYCAECLRPLRGHVPPAMSAAARGSHGSEEATGIVGLQEAFSSSVPWDERGLIAQYERDEQRVQAMAETFRKVGLRALAGVAAAPLSQRVQDAVEWAAPPGSAVLVVSKGDDSLLEFEGRRGWHFPQGKGGEYSGFHPASSTEAIEHLEELRDSGAGFLVLPQPSFWWLDYYAHFRDHLKSHYSLEWRDDRCIIYSLESDAGLANEDNGHRSSAGGI